jgi:S1-C subfamily serine protease
MALDEATILARARPAVVTVICTNAKGEEYSFGSGCIVSADGVVLTAWHVVAKAAKARVELATGAAHAVQGLIGGDASQDFALLKIEGKALPVVRLGDSDKVRQGDRILTLGAPLGLEQTASEGIVSAVRERRDGTKLLQITAPISPGSSGGPLLNAQGEVVGITSFLLTEGQSLNFAVAINAVKPSLGHGREQAADTTPGRGSGVTYEIYETQAGDTPALVAARVGVKVQDLCAWNKLSPFEPIAPGRALVIYRQRGEPPGKPQGQAIGRLALVRVASVAIRSRRGGGRVLYRVKRGAQLCVRDEKDGYYGVLMINGTTGWAPAAALAVQNVQILIPPGSLQGARGRGAR